MAFEAVDKTLMRVGFMLARGLKEHKEAGTSGEVSVTIHVANGVPAKIERDVKVFEKIEKEG
jgi:hypothetical protein